MILAIIQARMSSTRLPGKVMRALLGEPMLARQLERVRRSKRLDRVAVATSTGVDDDVIHVLCRDEHAACYRGSLTDVLGRYQDAADAFGPAEHVVRLTGDCPLADWEVIDAVVDRHLATGADYTCNTLELTFPKGLDVEVFTARALHQAAREARDTYEREHVTAYFYRNPERFRLANLACDPPMGDLRWTVDTPEDFAFVEKVYEALYPADPAFRSEDVVRLTAGWPVRGREG